MKAILRAFQNNGYAMVMAVTVAVMAMVPVGQARAAEDHAAPKVVAMDMVAAWEAIDLDKVIDLFSPDGALHSMMIDPIVGREALRTHLAPMFAGIDYLKLNLVNVAVLGNTVLLERVDEFSFNGKKGAVPVVGVLEIENGKVKMWREYYDRAALFSEMGVPMPAANGAGED
ncbi:MAG: hypothetical protein Tsb0016_19720 [Sphingomonadales bacterium]